jgi:hypothetical protein
MVHESHSEIHPILGRALRAVHGELRQRVLAAWRGGPPPRREAAAQETLRAFISRFTKVRGTIPRISDASIITAFRQGVRDEKMLEKLAPHQVETVTTLFALADKCARVAEGQNTRGKHPRQQRTDPRSYPVHPGARHSTAECCEIQKLAEHLSKRPDQTSKDGSSPPRQSSKEKVSDADAAATERELGYQTPNKDLKGLFHQSDSESGGDECHKKLYIMYSGSSELVSRWDVKTLRQEVFSVKPGTPKVVPHQRWRSTTISFGPSDCPENMAGAGVLPLVTAPTIANIRLHHVLIDGGADLRVISYAAFRQLQIPESKLAPSRPFSKVDPHPIYPVGTISMPVMFGTEVNFRTENVQFEVAEVNLPFNTIIGRPALYRFMVIAHYGYLVLKMSSPAGVLTVQCDRTPAVAAVEKPHALAAGLALTVGAEGSDPSPSRIKVPAKAPKVRPSDTDEVPVKTIQVGAEPSQTTRIGGNLGEK